MCWVKDGQLSYTHPSRRAGGLNRLLPYNLFPCHLFSHWSSCCMSLHVPLPQGDSPATFSGDQPCIFTDTNTTSFQLPTLHHPSYQHYIVWAQVLLGWPGSPTTITWSHASAAQLLLSSWTLEAAVYWNHNLISPEPTHPRLSPKCNIPGYIQAGGSILFNTDSLVSVLQLL